MSTTVYTEDGKQVTLNVQLNKGGGEGIIFVSPLDPLECAKIYHEPCADPRKLRLMVQRPPKDPTYGTTRHRSIAWPTAILYADTSRTTVAGFFMPRIDTKSFRTALAYMDPKDRTERFGGAFTWRYLFTAATNLASAVSSVHHQGYCIGDFNESNVLIAPNTLLTMIDCDSFQVTDCESGRIYRCPTGKDEYTAPEITGHYDQVDRTVESDCFALGVMIFQLLMEGTHPYQAKGRLVENATTTQAKIRLGYFPYKTGKTGIAPPDHAPDYDILSPEIQEYLSRCFVAGHANPKARPTAREWFHLLQQLASRFRNCTNPNHLFLDHRRTCPWCKMADAVGKDPFPSPAGQQIALQDAAALDSVEKRLAYVQTHIEMALADGVITTEELDYLIALGAQLQISAKDVERAIQAEAKRRNAVAGPRKTSSQGAVLEVSQTRFEFKQIRHGSQLSGKYLISNVGAGNLQGTIRASAPWIKMSNPGIDPARHRQEHGFTIDTSKLTIGSKNSGAIEIDSNGGKVRVEVVVSLEIERLAFARYRWTATALAACAGAAFGYVLYTYLLRDGASKAAVSGIAGLLGILGAVVVGARSAAFTGGCGALIVGSIVLATLETVVPAAFSGVAWATCFGALFYNCARPMFVGKHAGNRTPFVAVMVAALGLVLAVLVGATWLKARYAPRMLTKSASTAPVQIVAVSTCSSVSGWRHFVPKATFVAGEPICIYAEAQDVNHGAKIDTAFTLTVKGAGPAALIRRVHRTARASNDPSCWYSWPRLKLPANSPPGTYVAQIDVRNNLTGRTETSSTRFALTAPNEKGRIDGTSQTLAQDGDMTSSAPSSQHYEIPREVKTALDRLYPTWKPFPMEAQDVCKPSRTAFKRWLVWGDFDGNGMRDYAAQITYGQQNLVVALMSGPQGPSPIVADNEGWSLLDIAAKGTTLPDMQGGKWAVQQDTILGVRCESSAVAYVLTNSSFKRVFISD